MKTRDFHFDLPEELIAQQPCEQRSGSRLLHLARGEDDASCIIEHLQFSNFPDLLRKGDLLVFNDTRVIPARLFGEKQTGGKVEVLIERLKNEHQCLAHVRASKTPRPGSIISITNNDDSFDLIVEDRDNDLFVLATKNTDQKLTEIMEQAGHMPLPPYITRNDEEVDFERYQTVYSKKPGAVAAPTAGLHFDEEILEQIKQKGVQTTYVTLHVGAGTFQPVRSENIEDHLMHSEYLEVSQATVELCQQTKANGGRVIAIGTTAVRSLETASQDGDLKPYSGETDIFIYPGYEFRTVDAMLTNFHLPESTLIMLVCSFAGYEPTMRAYREAVAEKYRFFSYGDAMFIC